MCTCEKLDKNVIELKGEHRTEDSEINISVVIFHLVMICQYQI